MNQTYLPIEVSDLEDIARGVKTPYHMKKGKLHRSAFKPPLGQRCVSVIRLLLGDEYCNSKLKEICGQAYLGRAVLNVGVIRQKSEQTADVIDDRDEYLGHANLIYLNWDDNNPDNKALPFLQYLVEIARFEKD